MSSGLDQHVVIKETNPESHKTKASQRLGEEAWGEQKVSKMAGTSVKDLPKHIEFSAIEHHKHADHGGCKSDPKGNSPEQAGKFAHAEGTKPHHIGGVKPLPDISQEPSMKGVKPTFVNPDSKSGESMLQKMHYAKEAGKAAESGAESVAIQHPLKTGS